MIPPHTIDQIKTFRYEERLSIRLTAELVGYSRSTVWRLAPGRVWAGKVDNTQLREAFLSSGMSAHKLGLRIGWLRGSVGDHMRVKRALGLVCGVNGDGYRRPQRFVDYEIAALLAEGLGLDPWEVGA